MQTLFTYIIHKPFFIGTIKIRTNSRTRESSSQTNSSHDDGDGGGGDYPGYRLGNVDGYGDESSSSSGTSTHRRESS